MSEQSPDTEVKEKTFQVMDPKLHTLTPRHSTLYQRYQKARIVVDFGAAACFTTGSLLFFFPSTLPIAARLFLVGSLLFAVKPTIDLIRAFHLRRISRI